MLLEISAAETILKLVGVALKPVGSRLSRHGLRGFVAGVCSVSRALIVFL